MFHEGYISFWDRLLKSLFFLCSIYVERTKGGRVN